MYYSTIGLLALLVLIIVNWDILRNFKFSEDKPAWNVYRKFLFVVIAYYVTDILWGILDANKLETALFFDTTVYFVTMAVGISFWAEYTVAYLDDKSVFGKILVIVGRIIAGLITVFTVTNMFIPVLFKVDEDCVYKALPCRYVLLCLQILMLFSISVYAFLRMSHVKKTDDTMIRYKILAAFGIIMATLLLVQLFFPLLPVYSIGYMLGTCMLHSFVAEDEKELYRKEQEEAKKITELKDRFVSLLDNIPGMTFTKYAKTGVYITCNKGYLNYTQIKSQEELIGRTDADIFDSETAAHFVETDRIAMSLSKPYIYYEDVLDVAGNRRQLQTTKLKYTDTAGNLCILGICQDVTDMVRIQHEQAMTQEAYEKAVNNGTMYTSIAQTLARDYNDMYYINTDTEEYIEYGNAEQNRSLSEIRRGWHFFSDCKMEMAEKVYEDDRDGFLLAMNRKNLMKALDRKDTFIMTYRQMESGEPVYVNMKISRMEDEKYIIIGITNVDSEIKETMKKNETLIEALEAAEQATKTQTMFLSGMGHELRTPLNAIIGLCNLSQKKNNLDEETRRYMEKIEGSANNLLGLINNILNISRLESGKIVLHNEEFSLGSMIEQINTLMQTECNKKGLTYKCDVKEHTYGHYIGDEFKIKEALINILSNAVKFTEAPGEVTFTIEKSAEFDNESTIKFIVKDTGIGMEKEYLPRIFDAFSLENSSYRTKYGSSGLGLAITKKIVNVMNGSIEVDSEKGHGAEFSVTITLRNCESKKADYSQEINLEEIYVLIVDDDPIEAEHARMVLEEVGINAEICSSGQEALNRMEVQHAKQTPYNLILMDWNMPGMSGMETAAEINKLYNEESVVVAMTAYSWDDIHEEARKVGVDNYLSKPLFATNIIKNIERIASRCNKSIFKEKKQANLKGRRILLAEDVDINAEIMIDSLEMENIMTDRAGNGKEAVEMFENSTEGIYSAILMDVRMPEMDGLEATEKIRSLNRPDAKRIPIIALTANAFDEDIQRSIQVGMNAHLSKPVEAEQLIKILGELIYAAEMQ